MRRDQPIAALAADELSRRRRKIIKAGKNLRDCTPQQRHQLRIRGKKLRYATEFFAGVFPRKRSIRRHADLLSALKKLQDALGGLNDIATRAKLALAIAQDGDGDSQAIRERAFAAGMIVGLQDGRRARLLTAAERAFAGVAAAKPFWRDAWSGSAVPAEKKSPGGGAGAESLSASRRGGRKEAPVDTVSQLPGTGALIWINLSDAPFVRASDRVGGGMNGASGAHRENVLDAPGLRFFPPAQANQAGETGNRDGGAHINSWPNQTVEPPMNSAATIRPAIARTASN